MIICQANTFKSCRRGLLEGSKFTGLVKLRFCSDTASISVHLSFLSLQVTGLPFIRPTNLYTLICTLRH